MGQRIGQIKRTYFVDDHYHYFCSAHTRLTLGQTVKIRFCYSLIDVTILCVQNIEKNVLWLLKHFNDDIRD